LVDLTQVVFDVLAREQTVPGFLEPTDDLSIVGETLQGFGRDGERGGNLRRGLQWPIREHLIELAEDAFWNGTGQVLTHLSPPHT